MKRLPQFLIALCGLFALTTPADAGQAKITRVDGNAVTINAGVDRGVRVGMLAEIYRQSAPLIHPVTGEDLGNPKVKIARIEVIEVGAVTAEARFVEHYAPVQAGDIVESIEVAPTTEDQIRASVTETRAEMRELARSLAAEIRTNDKAIEDLRATLRRIGSSEARLRSIANDVRNVRERMVIFERRVVELEDNQQAILMRDTAEVKSSLPEDMTEISVLRRGLDEAIYLQVGDRTFRLSFEENALIPEVPGMGAETGDGLVPLGGGSAEDLMSMEPEAEDVPFYEQYWWVGALVGVVGALLVILLRFLRRPAAREEEEPDEAPQDDALTDGFPEAEVDEEFPEELEEAEAELEPETEQT